MNNATSVVQHVLLSVEAVEAVSASNSWMLLPVHSQPSRPSPSHNVFIICASLGSRSFVPKTSMQKPTVAAHPTVAFFPQWLPFTKIAVANSDLSLSEKLFYLTNSQVVCS